MKYIGKSSNHTINAIQVIQAILAIQAIKASIASQKRNFVLVSVEYIFLVCLKQNHVEYKQFGVLTPSVQYVEHSFVHFNRLWNFLV